MITKKDLTTKFKVLPYEIRSRTFLSPTCVNLHFRPYWVAELQDGQKVGEILEDGTERNFKEIDKTKLTKLHVIARGGEPVVTPLYSGIYPGRKYDLWVDLTNGIFYAKKQDGTTARVLECSELPVKYNEGVICFKETSIPIYVNAGSLAAPSTPMIDYIGIGYKIKWGQFKYQALCKIYMDSRTEFEITKTDLLTNKKISLECEPI